MKYIRSEKGFVFVTVAVLGSVLFAGAISYLQMIVGDKYVMRGSENLLKATALAEAGIEEVYWEYNYGGADFTSGDGYTQSGSTYSKTVSSFTDTAGTVRGNFAITITNATSTTPTVTVVSTVTDNSGGSKSVTMKTMIQPRPIFNQGILSQGAIHLDSNAYTDSYNSTTGVYGGANIAQNGGVITNSSSSSAVSLDSNAWIKGNATVGTGGGVSPSSRVTGTVTGAAPTTLPNNNTAYASTIASLSLLPNSGTMTANTTLSGNAKYTSINLSSNRTLTITGNVALYLTSTSTAFAMASNCDIEINSGASLSIYTAGNVALNSNCEINTVSGTNHTAQFSLIGLSTCTSVDFDSNVNLNGVINAPAATVHFDSNVDIYGAVIGNSVDLDSNASVHYDETLPTIGATSGTPTKISWVRRTA